MDILPLVVKNQFPEFVREQYPAFVEFVKQYYKWLSENHGDHLETINDIDKTPEQFVQYFRNRLDVYGLFNDAPDLKYIKNIKEIYSAKGSEAALTNLLRIVYQDDLASVKYPYDQVFKASNSKWQRESFITVSKIYGEFPSTFEYFYVRESTGEDLRVRCIRYTDIGNDEVRLFFNTLYGIPTYVNQLVNIKNSNGAVIYIGSLIPSPASINVIDPGEKWQKGQVFTIPGTVLPSLAKVISTTPTGGIIHAEITKHGYNHSITSGTGLFIGGAAGTEFNRGFIDTTNNYIEFSYNHGLSVNSPIVFQKITKDSVTQIVEGTTYYVHEVLSPKQIKLTNTVGGVVIDFTSALVPVPYVCTGLVVGTGTIDTVTNAITLANHGLANGDIVELKTSTIYTNLITDTTPRSFYYVQNATTNTFTLATEGPSGPFVDIVGDSAINLLNEEDYYGAHAIVKIGYDTIVNLPGSWLTNNSIVSDQTVHTQDNLYYQQFSYDVFSEVNTKSFKRVLQSLHPAGTKLYTTFDIRDSLAFNITASTVSKDTVLNFFDQFSVPVDLLTNKILEKPLPEIIALTEQITSKLLVKPLTDSSTPEDSVAKLIDKPRDETLAEPTDSIISRLIIKPVDDTATSDDNNVAKLITKPASDTATSNDSAAKLLDKPASDTLSAPTDAINSISVVKPVSDSAVATEDLTKQVEPTGLLETATMVSADTSSLTVDIYDSEAYFSEYYNVAVKTLTLG